MGKSLKGKELGKGITQRKDGLYQARFTDRFGKRRTIYDKTYSGVTKKLREEQYSDERKLNVINDNITLDEWFQIWVATYKKNCRANTVNTYTTSYNRIKDRLGGRKLTQLNLIIMQEAINSLGTDNQRKASKAVLVDVLNKAVDSELLQKNVAKLINTKVTKDKEKDRRVLTKQETNIFLKEARSSCYYPLFILALETGMRIGELSGLQWEDIDFGKGVIHVRHSLCYISQRGVCNFELHEPKTISSIRDIPLSTKAVGALKEQYKYKQRILCNMKKPIDGYENLVFITRENKPVVEEAVRGSIQTIIKRIRNKNPGLNFESISPHTFRHTFATRYIESGVQPKTVQRLLGHSTLRMTMDLYCHVTNDTLYEAVEKYEEFMS